MVFKKYLWLLLALCIFLAVLGALFVFTPRRISVSLSEPFSFSPLPVAKEVHIPPHTIPQFFNNRLDFPETITPEEITTVLVTGDVLTARSVNAKTVRFNNFNWAWERVATELRNANLTVINLETPLVKECPVRDDGMIFCGDSRHVQGLQFAGVDVVNFANNHAGNWGQEGVAQTVDFITRAGMEIAGVSGRGPVYREVNGITFGFVGYNEVDLQVGINLSEQQLIAEEIAEAKKQADVVIVQFHWGNEYTYQPSSHQQLLAHFAIDQGADLVIGNHPHWYQPVEIYNNRVIMYSHGNFIFDQMWSRETREGIVGKYYFYRDKLIDVEFLPMLIEDYGQPQWLEGEEKEKVLEHLFQISH